MHRICHGERVWVAIRVVRIRAQRKQSSNCFDGFGALPRLSHSEVEQCCAVSSGRLQIGDALCCSADCVRIILDDTLGDSEQRRLIAEVPLSGVQLRLELAAMLLAFFQRYEANDEKRNHGANTDKDYKAEHADRPFKDSSSFHSLAIDEHRPDTDYKPL